MTATTTTLKFHVKCVRNQLRIGGEALVRRNRDVIAGNANNAPHQFQRDGFISQLASFEAAMAIVGVSK